MELTLNRKPHPLRDQAKLLYFATPEATVEELAKLLGITRERFAQWISREKWKEQRDTARSRALEKKPNQSQAPNASQPVTQDCEIVTNLPNNLSNQGLTSHNTVVNRDRSALSPEKMAELMAQRSISTKERLSRAVHRAAEHAADVMTEDELIDKADKLNNLAKTASTVHAWDGAGAGGHGGININILTDEVKIVQLTTDNKT
jgi:hypothetical protein